MVDPDAGIVSPELAEALRGTDPTATVRVVIELPPTDLSSVVGRAERIAQGRHRFAESTRPLAEHIATLDGEIVESNWLNSTILAQIPAGQISALAGSGGILRIDVTSVIQPDTE